MPTGRAPSTRGLPFFRQAAKARTPAELVRSCMDVLLPLSTGKLHASDSKKLEDLDRDIEEIMHVLYGSTEAHPNQEAVGQLTQEVFRGEFLSLLIKCVPRMLPASRQPSAQIVAALQRQQVGSRLVASEYLVRHPDILDLLLKGYEDPEVAVFYGSMLRDCIRHQDAAQYILSSPHFFDLFRYMELPEFDIASDAAATFKELLLRHKSTAAAFLSKTYSPFFSDYSKLLSSPNYVTRRMAVKLLADMLSERAFAGVTAQYVRDPENLKLVMNLLKDSSKTIQIDALQLFRIIAMSDAKSEPVAMIIASNKEKLLRFFQGLTMDKGSEQEKDKFEKDKEELKAAIEATRV